jgi:hypothetical protein
MSDQAPKPTGDDFRAVLDAMREQIWRVEYPDRDDDDVRALQTILHDFAHETVCRAAMVIGDEANRLARARHNVPGEQAPPATAEDYLAVLQAIDEQIERVDLSSGPIESREDDAPVAAAIDDFAWNVMGNLILGIKAKAKRLAQQRHTP